MKLHVSIALQLALSMAAADAPHGSRECLLSAAACDDGKAAASAYADFLLPSFIKALAGMAALNEIAAELNAALRDKAKWKVWADRLLRDFERALIPTTQTQPPEIGWVWMSAGTTTLKHTVLNFKRCLEAITVVDVSES